MLSTSMGRGQCNSWMNEESFKSLFYTQFVLSLKRFGKANNHADKVVLLIDNTPSHLVADE